MHEFSLLVMQQPNVYGSRYDEHHLLLLHVPILSAKYLTTLQK